MKKRIMNSLFESQISKTIEAQILAVNSNAYRRWGVNSITHSESDRLIFDIKSKLDGHRIGAISIVYMPGRDTYEVRPLSISNKGRDILKLDVTKDVQDDNLYSVIDDAVDEIAERNIRRINTWEESIVSESVGVDLDSLNLKGMSRYLKTFFQEKDLPFQQWTLKSKDGMPHIISNEVVIEAIAGAPKNEQTGIANMIRRIDFVNGDVNKYLKHLAQALVDNY